MAEDTEPVTKRTTIVQQPTVSISRKEYKDGAASWNVDVTAPLDADWASLIDRMAEARKHAHEKDREISVFMAPTAGEEGYVR